MKKAILIFLLAVVLISGCPQPPGPDDGGGNGNDQQPPQDQQPYLECPPEGLTQKEFDQWITAISECSVMEGMQLARCIDEYSFICFFNSDISNCDKETDSEKKDNCYRRFANYLEDHTLCDKLSTTKAKDICYIDVAVRAKNKSICELAVGESYKSICIFALDNTPEKCETLTQNVDACYNIVTTWNAE